MSVGSPSTYPLPNWERQKLSELKCPPLISKKIAPCKMDFFNKRMETQQNTLETLKKQISDIDARFPIRFKLGTVHVTTIKPDEAQPFVDIVPSADISGALPNPTLSFTVFYPEKGNQGIRGVPGDDGDAGDFGYHGDTGFDGYWGVHGKI
jgi:hypothetical protein